jgi:single-stranded-DNA-specific exonuclease
VVALRESFAAAVSAQETGASESAECDAEVRLQEVDERLCEELGALAPFGQANVAPLLVARGVTVRSSRRVGDGSHLKLEVEAGGEVRGAIGFGLGEQEPGIGARLDLAFSPQVSSWQGRRRVELEVRAIVPC